MSHLRGGFKTSLPTDQRTRYRTSTNDLDWAEEQARHDEPNVGETERMISDLDRRRAAVSKRIEAFLAKRTVSPAWCGPAPSGSHRVLRRIREARSRHQ